MLPHLNGGRVLEALLPNGADHAVGQVHGLPDHHVGRHLKILLESNTVKCSANTPRATFQ